MSNQSKTDRQATIRKVLAGIDQYYANLPQLRLAGTVYTIAALKQFLNGDIAASDLTDQARANLSKAAAAQKATRASTNPVLRAIRNLVLADYGDSLTASDVLAVFGYSPRKPRKAKGTEMAATAAKAAATREARGTKGKKQKKSITGTTAKSSGGASNAKA